MTTKGDTRTRTSRRWLRRWGPWFFHSRENDAVFPPIIGPVTRGALIFWPFSLVATLLRHAPIFVVWITVLLVFSGYVDMQKAKVFRLGYWSGRAVGCNETLSRVLTEWMTNGVTGERALFFSDEVLDPEHDPPSSDTRPST